MKVNLIYNPNSGHSADFPVQDLLLACAEIGWDVNHLITTQETDLDRVLNGITGTIIVAGGDGTIRAVAARVMGNPDIQILPLPVGTANNITNTLGLTGNPRELMARFHSTRTLPFDVGHVLAPWGEDYFFEAIGVGLFADSMAMYNPMEGKSFGRAITTATKVIPDYTPHDFALTVDSQDMSGSYVLVEIFNTKSTGPRLKLAPDAEAHDGYLDLVGIRSNERTTLLGYLRHILAGTLDDMHNVETLKVKHIDLTWTGFPVHVDGILRTDIEDESLSKKQLTNPNIAIDIIPNALTFILPKDD